MREHAIIYTLAFATALSVRTTGTQERPALSPRNTSYTLDARLDTTARVITGTGELRWRNDSPIPATELRFHLYWNAWRDDRSTWMRELALEGDFRLHGRPERDRGSIDLDSISVDGSNLTSRLRFIAPDDGNAYDRTVAAVPLDRPVAPGETISVQLKWRSRVPRPYSRTGAIADYYFIAHWFPKIGVPEAEGWNCHQFHSATEFFADFGVYDVRLTVPAGWILGATGREKDRRDNGDGSTTHHYYQEDVHDFAWTTSPDFVERRARFEHPGLPPADMRLLLQPEHLNQEARHFEATRAALRYYGEWYGPYPYGHVTIVDPAWQSRSGGMEYPTFFTAGTRWLAPEGTTEPEDVTVHEAGHQLWYGVVATNEFEHAWMDEGLTQFSEGRVMGTAFPGRHPSERFFGGFIPWVYRDIRLARETDLNYLAAFRPHAEGDVQSTLTFRQFPGETGYITYFKTALWLNTLERWIGWPKLQTILSTFFHRWAFKHPKPDDFFAIAHDAGVPEWFFDEVHRSSNAFDYAVEELRSWPLPSSDPMFETTVVVRRHGEAVFPVDIRVDFEDGSHQLASFAERSERWKILRYTTKARAVRAQVDPDRVLLLDVNLTNNSVTLEPRATQAARKWSLVWMAWLQDLMLTWASFV
jgi:Peptidase family M1 domain